jgi:hypothetical protein
MANSLLTPTQITREALRVLHNNLAFLKGVNRQYSNEFGRTGAKIGTTVNVRKPNRYYVRKGDAMQTQGTQETYIPLTLSTKWGTDISFNTTELTLSLDDFSKRILTPAMARIASQIDQDCLQATITGTYNNGTGPTVSCGPPINSVVGTPGTTPGTAGTGTLLTQTAAPIVYLNAGMMMDNSATPRDASRRCLLSPAAMAQSVAGLSGLFNDQSLLSEQYRKGILGNALGFEFCMDQNVYTFYNSSTSGTISLGNITLVAGSTTASCASVTSGANFAAGTIFTVAGVYAVNPENQLSTGQLQQFVVTADVTATTTTIGALSIYPAPILAGVGVANGTVNSIPGATATTIISGTTGQSSFQQSLAYHQDAFTFATADLEIPNGVDFSAREVYDGISMRIVRQYTIGTDEIPCRIDVLGGFANLRPELACRVTG